MPLTTLPNFHDLEHISADLASDINMVLSDSSVESIPNDQRTAVLDYLICALNIESVDPAIIAKLENLVAELQAVT